MANEYFYALGRRKSSTAKVRLKSGTGKIIINNKPASSYFEDSEFIINNLNKPFQTIDNNKFDATVVVHGGGTTGQVEAVRLGLSKALVAINPDYKGTLKRAGLLSRDSRGKERKKFGLKKARKQRQFTKR